MFKKFRKNLLQLVLITFVLYFLVLVFLYFYQRNLLYHPNENNYSGDKISVDIKKVKIRTSDDIDLLGWYHEKNLKDYKTLIYFHGNAGSLENRIFKNLGIGNSTGLWMAPFIVNHPTLLNNWILSRETALKKIR